MNFVEAGTETSVNPTLVKTMEVKADQTVVTPQSAAAKELVNMGYALVNRAGDQYMVVTEAKDLQWIDTTGTSHSTEDVYKRQPLHRLTERARRKCLRRLTERARKKRLIRRMERARRKRLIRLPRLNRRNRKQSRRRNLSRRFI